MKSNLELCLAGLKSILCKGGILITCQSTSEARFRAELPPALGKQQQRSLGISLRAIAWQQLETRSTVGKPPRQAQNKTQS